MKTAFAVVIAILSLSSLSSAEALEDDWDAFADAFKSSYVAMELPSLQLSYAKNIEALQTEDQLISQRDRFQAALERLDVFEISSLSKKQRLDYQLIRYESQVNLERIELGLRWYELEVGAIPEGGLRGVPMGEEWYAYFLKKWVDASATPERIYALGEAEVARVKSEIDKIRISRGLDASEFKDRIREKEFFYHSAEEVRVAFEAAQNALFEKLPEFFPYIEEVGPTAIVRGTNRELTQVPAFYNHRTLYFNYFDTPFNRRQIYWIYLHESVPGHHYQVSLANDLPQSEIQTLFSYPGYVEGWAAYIEDLGLEIGLYDDVYSELGKWEWDLIRSVRLVLDVGLNYYKWSDEKALTYWKSHIEDLDDIGQREIDRMKRWPAQVVTYKQGAKQFLRLKDKAVADNGLSLYDFHQMLMDVGPLPLSTLDKYLSDGLPSYAGDSDERIGKVAVTKDLRYYNGPDSHPEKHKLDLYLPEANPSAPILLWIHGGAWSIGDRKNEAALAMRFAERGVGVAAMSYRLSRPHLPGSDTPTSGVTHPEHIKDVAQAFGWLKKNIAKFGGEQREIFVGGHSSGAHLAALLATNPKYLAAHGLEVNDVAGVIPIEGAYDIEQYRSVLISQGDEAGAKEHIEVVFGTDRDEWKDSSPALFLKGSSVPFLVVTGDQDAFNQYAEPFVEASKYASDVRFFHARNRNHSTVYKNIIAEKPDFVRREIINFIRKRSPNAPAESGSGSSMGSFSYPDNEFPGIEPKVFSSGFISKKDEFEFRMSISSDGTEYYYSTYDAAEKNYRTMATRYEDGQWTEPRLFAPTGLGDFEPFISHDGNRFYFSSNRAPAKGIKDSNIWKMERVNGHWGEPKSMPFNTSGSEWVACEALSGNIYFARFDDEDEADIFVYDPEKKVSNRLDVVNEKGSAEFEPFIDADERFMVFSTSRDGDENAASIYISVKTQDSWGKPVSLGERINNGQRIYSPNVSPDQKYLFFSREGEFYWVDFEQTLALVNVDI